MKLLETALIAVVGGAIVIGVYQAGKMKERDWWRTELASRNQEVKATLLKLGQEAEGLDATLLRIIEGDRARLEDAEAQIQVINKKPAATAELDGVCRPVSAACLQRGRPDNRPQAHSAAASGAAVGR